MTNYTIAINAYFHAHIRIYYIDSDNKLDAIKKAITTFIRETMNMYHANKDALMQQVRSINSLDYLLQFLTNNSINCTFQETPINIPKLPFPKHIEKEGVGLINLNTASNIYQGNNTHIPATLSYCPEEITNKIPIINDKNL